MSKDSPVWQNIESELQNRSDEYIELREKWSIDFLRVIESDEEKIETFNEKVLPCLANQVILPSFSKSKKRWICLFDNCKLKKTSFISKFTYVRHLLALHSSLLPGGGGFLSPNSAFNTCTEFKCNNCGSVFKRNDHLKSHSKKCFRTFKSDEFCPDDSDEESKSIIEKIDIDSSLSGVEDDNLSSTIKTKQAESLKKKRELSSYSLCGDDLKKTKCDTDDVEETEIQYSNTVDEEELDPDYLYELEQIEFYEKQQRQLRDQSHLSTSQILELLNDEQYQETEIYGPPEYIPHSVVDPKRIVSVDDDDDEDEDDKALLDYINKYDKLNN